MSTSGPSIEQLKAGMRAAWMAGDFGEVAKRSAQDAAAFIDRLSIPPQARALDIACGTGNLAIPLARRGAQVTGVDIAPNLLEQARARAAAENLNVTFNEGDAEQLPYPDASFDVVVSMFGAMFAPRPELVVAEMARVLKPGGLLAMANWNPGCFTGDIFRVTTKHVPPAPGLRSPLLWGDETAVRERLAHSFKDIATQITPLEFDFAFSPREVVAFFRRYYGPTQTAFSRLDDSGQQALAADLEVLWSKANVAPDAEHHTLVHNQYLQVTATRK